MARLKVGTALARAGAWTTGTLTLGHYPDGPITTPVNILSGRQPGKVLWVQAAIHGAECGGALGLLKLMKRIDRTRMRGAIVGIMAANPTAFRALERNTPYDGENMNRLFERPSRTSQSRQAAAILMETAWSTADAMMDLHSGGIQEVVPFYALYWEDGSPASQESARLARAAATPHIWRSTDAWLGGAMYTNFTKRGKPALIIECGSGGDLKERDVDNFANAIEGVARALGILPGRAPAQKRYRYLGSCDLVYNQRGGYFLPAVAPGATVVKKQVLGRVMDAHGKLVEEIRAPAPSFIAAIVRDNRAIHSGTMVAECCAIEA